jgi:hypothetical protein
MRWPSTHGVLGELGERFEGHRISLKHAFNFLADLLETTAQIWHKNDISVSRSTARFLIFATIW